MESLPLQNTFPAPLEESILESVFEEYLNPKAKETTIVISIFFLSNFITKFIFFIVDLLKDYFHDKVFYNKG